MQPAVEKQYRMKDSVPRNVRARVWIIKRAPNADRKKKEYAICVKSHLTIAYSLRIISNVETQIYSEQGV